MTLKIKVNDPNFNSSRDILKVHILCEFGDCNLNPLQVIAQKNQSSENSESK